VQWRLRLALHQGAAAPLLNGEILVRSGPFAPLAGAPSPARLDATQHWHGDAGLQPDANNRTKPRSNVFLSAVIFVGAVPLPVRVRNLSSQGALLDGGSLPSPGARVRLVRGDLSAEGEVAWQTGGQAGLRFAGEINVNEWVKRVGHPGQQRVDTVIAALRDDVATPANADVVEPPSLARVSQELNEICERLASSPGMTVELGEELVKLDSLAHALRQLASRG
jgi:hypothetical protein